MTMSSSQLGDVVIPVPSITVQEEVVESDLISTKAASMMAAASSLRDSSSDLDAVRLAEKVMTETERFLKGTNKRVSVSAFLPS